MGFIWDEKKEDDSKFKKHIKTIKLPFETTNKDHLEQIKKLKKKNKAFEDVDLKKLQEESKELKELKDKGREGETELEKQVRVMKEDHDKLKIELEDSKKKTKKADKKAIVDDVLYKHLVKNGVKKEMLEAAFLLNKQNVSVLEEDGKMVAKVGDKSIKEAVKEWAKSDEGKFFVGAKRNSGGGAGGGGESATESEQEKFFDKESSSFNRTKQVMLKKKDPDMYSKLLKKFDK